ncbi:MAG: hypothetical protein M3Y41_07945 [Pseudomonadota bacterium]|nr:hypothetical protein [Pseudomonadota bacterium]
MSRTITVPPDADIGLTMQGRRHMVIVAPAPLKANLTLFTRPGTLGGWFTFDPGLTWPDRNCCRFASHYLQTGIPIGFEFAALADALACHRRLLREAGR